NNALKTFHVRDFLGQIGAWSNDTHVPHEDVKYLGQLIQTVSPQDFTYTGYSRVVAQLPVYFVFLIRCWIVLENLFEHRVGVLEHGPELQDVKTLTPLSHPQLRIEDRPAGIQFDEKRNQTEKRCEHNQSDCCTDEVDDPFRKAPPPAPDVVPHTIPHQAGVGARAPERR